MTILDPEAVLPIGVLVGGDWVQETTAGTLPHYNAATGKVQRHFPAAGAAEVDDAVTAARAALAGWRSWRPAQPRRRRR